MSLTKSPLRSPGRPKSSGTLASLGVPRAATGLAACLAYGTVSVSITLFNKAVFSTYHFEYPAFVTMLQVRGGGAGGAGGGRRKLRLFYFV